MSLLTTEIKVLLTAMIPIGELRVALPLALISYNINIIMAYILSVVGNVMPVFFLLLFWRYLAGWLARKSRICKVFFDWLLERTRNKFSGNYAKWGKLALVIFVAVPLPGTGAWTGTVAAWLFGFKYWESVGLIFLGICLAGVAVGIITMGGIMIF